MNSETLKNKLKPIVYPIINFIPRRRLKNLKHYLSGDIPLKFVKESKYIKDFDNAYPLALLDDIELHFLHYADEEEATQKGNAV